MIRSKVPSVVLFQFNSVNYYFFIGTAGNLIVEKSHNNASLCSKRSGFYLILYSGELS